MQSAGQAMKAQSFIERYIVCETPPHVADLFDHDEGTHSGRLVAFALMLASANIVALIARQLFLS
jgi:hypothetical protein